jgi:hypothetical protein
MTAVVDKDALGALIAALAQVNLPDVTWDTSPDNAMVSPETAAKITLSIFGLVQQGIDEHRVAFNPGGYPANSLVTTEIGNREVTINMLVELYDKGLEASEMIDRVRTGIRSAKSTAALNAINLALETATKTTRFPMTREQRAVSAATCDFMFGGIAQQVSDVVGPTDGGGWIDELDGVAINIGGLIPGTFTE